MSDSLPYSSSVATNRPQPETAKSPPAVVRFLSSPYCSDLGLQLWSSIAALSARVSANSPARASDSLAACVGGGNDTSVGGGGTRGTRDAAGERGARAGNTRLAGQGWAGALTSGPMSFLPLERSRFDGGPAAPLMAAWLSSNAAMASTPTLHSHSHVLYFSS